MKRSYVRVVAVICVSAVVLMVGVMLRHVSAQQSEQDDSPVIVYQNQEECESTVGRACHFMMCDYIPEGKTFEEVCGKDFHNGWYPDVIDKTPVDADMEFNELENEQE